MMSSEHRPWYKWYPKDFVVDEKVQCLSAYSELIYRRMLDIMWQSSTICLPFDKRLVKQAVGKNIPDDDFDHAWDELFRQDWSLFSMSDDGKWIFSNRLRREYKDAINLSETRREASLRGVAAKKKRTKKHPQANGLPNGQANVNQRLTDTDTDNNPIVPLKNSFDTFWKAYPKKVGKGAAEKAWKRIPKNNGYLDIILSAIEKQKQSEQWRKDNGQYIPNPATYLNQRRWEDEGVIIAEKERHYVDL